VKRPSLAELQAKYGIQRRVVTELVRGGIVRPERGARGAYAFSFQDIQLMRVAQDLYAAGISPVRTTRFLSQLLADRQQDTLPARSVGARGRELVVREGCALRTPDGQLVIDFEEGGRASIKVLLPAIDRMDDVHGTEPSAEEWFLSALYIEKSDPATALQHYRRALSSNPCYADAYINIVCLHVERGEWEAARAACEEAIGQCPDAALLHYNLGVVLEECGGYELALQAYQRALALDSELADAHYNLAILHDTRGERAAALRHLREYRKHK
jgi:tetratricopeptide (TPR) repeat protein